MTTVSSTASASGVRVADDFRDNLIIDRYDPIFLLMRASKLKHLRSENSEDAQLEGHRSHAQPVIHEGCKI